MEDSDRTVTISVEGNKFEVNLKKLSEASVYFETMFNGSFAESTKEEIVLEGVKLEMFEFFSDWLVKKDVNFNEINIKFVLLLYVFADRFMIEELKEKCIERLGSAINTLPAFPCPTMHGENFGKYLASLLLLYKFSHHFMVDELKQLCTERMDSAMHNCSDLYRKCVLQMAVAANDQKLKDLFAKWLYEELRTPYSSEFPNLERRIEKSTWERRKFRKYRLKVFTTDSSEDVKNLLEELLKEHERMLKEKRTPGVDAALFANLDDDEFIGRTYKQLVEQFGTIPGFDEEGRRRRRRLGRRNYSDY